MIPCLAQTCTLPASIADDFAAVRSAGATAIEGWLTKLERELTSPPEGLTIPVVAGQGGLLLAQGEQRDAAWDHFKRRLDLCQRFNVGMIVLSPDVMPHATINDLAMAIQSLGQAAEWAASFGMKIALEFQANSTWCSNLETAVLIVEQLNHSSVGLCLDAFHFGMGPSKAHDLKLLTQSNLFHVQLCDVAGVPREFAKDADRVFPGEGDLELTPILQRLKDIGYERYVSLELFNPVLWKAKPSQVMELGYAALLRTLKLFK